MRTASLLLLMFLLFAFRQSNEAVKQLSLDFTSRILEKGRYMTVSGEVYFRKQDGLLLTRLVKPFETITIVNAEGEMKIYDPKDNTLVQNQSMSNSTETSYFWHFLNGSYNDLGLSRSGYQMSGSKVQGGLLLTTWVPRQGFATPIASIEMVHEKALPIYLAFRNSRWQLLGKIYFSAYNRVGGISLPARITEIDYSGKDSSITNKQYFNAKLNASVNEAFINYKIPGNAKILATH
jgi:hypothetical protein